MTKKDSKKPLHKALQLSGAGFQMGITIYLGFRLGEWLDLRFQTSLFTIITTLVAVFLATYLLIRQAKKIND